MSGTVDVLLPGLYTTVQDLGRWGHQASGVPVAGPMDQFSHRLANILVGNARGLATLTSSVGLGSLLAGLWLAQRASAVQFARIALASAAGLCVAALAFGASSNLWAGAVALGVAGFTAVGVSVTTQTLLQKIGRAHV